MKEGGASDIRKRVREHRLKLRSAGLRPVQLWLPDTRKPGFRAACRRQSRLLQDDPLETEVLDWLEAAGDESGWR